MSVRVSPLPAKPYRPHNPRQHKLLLHWVRMGYKISEIAAMYGGTPDGVRSNLRRLRERGVL